MLRIMNDLYQTGIKLWADWTEMWNGRPELALELVAARFVLHLPSPSPFDTAAVSNPAAVARFVSEARARFERITFHYEAGPYVDTAACVVAGPWWAASESEGKPKLSAGMDTIAFRDGKITEYWTLSKEVDRVGDWVKALAPMA
jgi:hypothetical protein